MAELSGFGFLNKITFVPAKSIDDNDKYFVSLSYQISLSEDDKKTQYLDCYVSKALQAFISNIEKTQYKSDEVEGRFIHALSGQLVHFKVLNPLFKIDNEFLNSSGILSELNFKSVEKKN
jgi:hypothetical protein